MSLKNPNFLNALQWIKEKTTIVADTGDIQQIIQFKPQDATTNPTLILQAAKLPQYSHLLEKAKKDTAADKKILAPQHPEFVHATINRLSVLFGVEILKHIQGRISTELPPNTSFDTQSTLLKAKEILALYNHYNIPPNKILLKIPATYEGILAAEKLEKINARVNLTLLFSQEQAILAANAKATLISPFVGRILDWHLKNPSNDNQSPHFLPPQEPGVLLVKQIYDLFQSTQVKTQVMAASFRNIPEILALRGIHLLTISPNFLQKLQLLTHFPKNASIISNSAKSPKIPLPTLSEAKFRWLINENVMANTNLNLGIHKFQLDYMKLYQLIAAC